MVVPITSTSQETIQSEVNFMSDRARIALSISTRSNGTAPTLATYRGFMLGFEALAADRDLGVPLDWVLLDDHGDTRQSALLAETVVADPRFVGVVGPMGSSEAFANAPIFSAGGLLQVSPCASHPDLCRKGYQTFHRLVANEETQGGALARLAINQLQARKVAVVHDSDAFGVSVADNFCSAFESIGGSVSTRVSISKTATEFENLAQEVAASDPETVFFGVHATEGLLVSAAIRATGCSVPFLGTDGLKTSFFLGGGDPGQEAVHTHTGADFRRLESARSFRERYMAAYPEDSTYSPEAYDSVMMIGEALKQAGSVSRPQVLEAFADLTPYQGITGTVSFDEVGERVDAPVSWYRVARQDGERVMNYQGVVV
ncbi:MAG: ABC transporter substrate-binding protein [Acidimicrobiia bacterium]|nr:ABC transporter substrate-binding protein [Acidimicrobiia bacterium]